MEIVNVLAQNYLKFFLGQVRHLDQGQDSVSQTEQIYHKIHSMGATGRGCRFYFTIKSKVKQINFLILLYKQLGCEGYRVSSVHTVFQTGYCDVSDTLAYATISWNILPR